MVSESPAEQQHAELLAINYAQLTEEKERLRKAQQEQFRQKTKQQADKVLLQQKKEKEAAQNQKTLQAREQLLKTREYAAKQRR